jgi:hypothetical protein
MILMPDPSSAVIDPFFDDNTLILRCDIIEPKDMQGYERDPRSIARRAEAYMASTGIADTAFFGPENEFFIFDDVRWNTDMGSCSYQIDSEEAGWNSSKVYEDGNIGHRPGVKGGYFPVPPVDSLQDMRSAMCLVLEEMGQVTEVHHHEVATAGQCELGVRFNTLVKKADEVLELKYVWIGHKNHVRFVNTFPACYRRAVKHIAFFKSILINTVCWESYVLLFTAGITKTKINKFDVIFLKCTAIAVRKGGKNFIPTAVKPFEVALT